MNPSSSKRVHDFNMEHFCIRLTARLCIILICILTIIPRISVLIVDPNLSAKSYLLVIISFPFPILMAFVIGCEYFLYRKLGPDIIKYSSFVDIVLLFFFTADWVIILVTALNDTEQAQPVCFRIATIYGFTTFSWRTLMVTLIVEKWQFKIIPPTIAIAVSAGYAIHYVPSAVISTLCTAGFQLFNIILIIYCEDKVKWKLMWANIQKQKWMQVNDFILNSIPENIIMLDLQGETKFISEYCKSFMEKSNLSLETKDFFQKIQDLKQQQSEPPSTINLQTERMTSINMLLPETPRNLNFVTLEEVITSFKDIILNKEIQERQFLIYNGKLQIENHSAKSLEIKISFVQHFENSYVVLMLRDTTQRNLLITLEETNKYKDQLLASVSHELRAPLNGNINLVESAVNSGQIPEKVKENLLIPALRSSKFLLHIINDILDMSQIKEHKLRLVFQNGDLRDTIRSVTQLVELQAKKKGIELNIELDSSLPNKFCTDHIRLSQIVLNLLNNGIKFTNEGIVKLTVEPGPESLSVKITVKDSGIGMCEENLQKLFTNFTHIEFEGRESMNPTGAGLGLNIAHNLALLLSPKGHSGITAKSIPGQGSTFTFLLENHQEEPEDSGELLDETPEQLVQFMPSARLQGSRLLSSSTVPLMGRSESFSLLNNSCLCPQVLIVDDNPFNP